MKVKATRLGFMHGHRYRPGTEFECAKSEFSERWMEKVDTRGRKPKVDPEEPKEGFIKEDIPEALLVNSEAGE